MSRKRKPKQIQYGGRSHAIISGYQKGLPPIPLLELCPKYKFFCKTDVKSYYESIAHYTLLMKLYNDIHDSKIIGYVWQFLN